MTRHLPTLLLALLLTAAALLRFSEAHRTVVQPDEAWSLMLAAGHGSAHLQLPPGAILPNFPPTTSMSDARPFYTIPTSLTDITHPPLYYTALGAVRALFPSESAARNFSLLCSLASLAALYAALRRLASTEVALWTIALLALSRTHLELSIEIRPYALVLLGFSLALWGLAGHLTEMPRRRATTLLAAGATILLFTHYFALGVVLALLLAALIFPPTPHRRPAALAVALPLLAFALLWSPMMLAQSRSGVFAITDPTTSFLFSAGRGPLAVASTFADAPARLLMKTTPSSYPYAYASCLLLLIPLALRKSRPTTTPTPLTATLLLSLLTLAALGPPLILDLLRRSEHLYHPRYIILALPACTALLSCLTLAPTLRAVGRLLPASALLGTLLSIPSFYTATRFNYPEFSDQVESLAPPTSLLIFTGDDPTPYRARENILLYSHFRKHNHPIALLLSPPTPEFLAALPEDFWVVDHFGWDTYQTYFPNHRTVEQKAVWGLGRAVHLTSKAQ